MHVLDPLRFEGALKDKGYKSLSELALSLGIHRNTLHYYLRGQPVFSEKLEKIFSALDVDPLKFIVKKTDTHAIRQTAPVADIIDSLFSVHPKAAYVFFGSRAADKGHVYSDWDIGVFSQDGLSRNEFKIIKRKKNLLEEESAYFIDLINLNQSSDEFIKNISQHWQFLAGRHKDWLALQQRALS